MHRTAINTMNKLEEIVLHKQREISAHKKERPLSFLKLRAPYNRIPRSIIEQFRSGSNGFGIIAEFKRQSPSAGIINDNVDPVEITARYISSGAVAISVLTDEKYFGGSLSDLESVSNTATIPVLRKDFIVDEYQIYEAKAYGADAVLLIADVLTKNELNNLYKRAADIGLECLVEVYDRRSIEKIDFDTMKLIGINNRDLRTFTVDLNHTKEIKQQLPDDVLVISESGLQNADDIRRVKSFGVNGALIGESLMKNGARMLNEFNT